MSLTLKHQRDAILIGNDVARKLGRLARSANAAAEIDLWWEQNEAEALALVQSAHQSSMEAAIQYLLSIAKEHNVEVDALTPALWNAEQAATSLRVTGPVAFKQAMREHRNPLVAKKIMTTRFTASGQRLALAGGRDTIFNTSRDSKNIVGYRRVTDGKGCDFCQMLAGRGAVYGEFSGQFQAHDGDGCSVEPVFE